MIVKGVGDLQLRIYSIDDAYILDTPTISLSLNPGIQKTREFLFENERASCQIKVDKFGEWFSLRDYRVFGIPIWAERADGIMANTPTTVNVSSSVQPLIEGYQQIDPRLYDILSRLQISVSDIQSVLFPIQERVFTPIAPEETPLAPTGFSYYTTVRNLIFDLGASGSCTIL